MESANGTSLLDEGVVFNKYTGNDGGKFLPKMIVLRVVNNPVWKPINVKKFRRLSYSQGVNAGIIMFLQVIMYAIKKTPDYYQVVDMSGLGLIGPLIFFSTSSLLTWVVTTKSRSRCFMGTTLGFQITSVTVGLILTILATVSLAKHGRNDCSVVGYERTCNYDPEIVGRIFTSMMVISAIMATLISLVTSVMLCRVEYCCKSNLEEFENGITFEVEDADV